MSWNVDGLRDNVWPWVDQLLTLHQPHILCLNETKRTEANLRKLFETRSDYTHLINVHAPANHHGVAMLIRKDLKYLPIELELPGPVRKDNRSGDPGKGRILAVQLQLKTPLNLLATYVPNSGTDHSYRVNHWDPLLFSVLNEFLKVGPTVWIGDLNVAPTDLDLSHPKKMRTWPGVSPEERANFSVITENWLDSWRLQHPTEKKYSYRGYGKTGGREATGTGMRLDMAMVSKDLKEKVVETVIYDQSPAPTDHVPIGLWLKC